jgi:hypothetical protein
MRGAMRPSLHDELATKYVIVMRRRLTLALTHLGLSALVITTFVLWVILVWYPSPLTQLQGITAILLILVFVDVCLGPLLTFVIASPHKARGELFRDIAIIGLVQVGALGYGAYTTFVARPAFIVFNANRFDVIAATELVWKEGRKSEDRKFSSAPVFGPIWAHALPPASVAERNEILFSAVEGGPDLKNLPHLFHAWPEDAAAVRSRLRPMSELAGMSDQHQRKVQRLTEEHSLSADQLAYVPLIGRSDIGVVILRRSDLSVVTALALQLKY